jgi:Phage integrase family
VTAPIRPALAQRRETRERRSGETGTQWASRFPPRPLFASWPQTRTTRAQMTTRLLANPFALDNPDSQQTRRQGLLTVVGWLQDQAGDSWQQRWKASGAEDAEDWRDLVANWAAGRRGSSSATIARPPHLSSGLLVLVCGDVVRPDLAWLARFAPARRSLAEEMARTRDPDVFARLTAKCDAAGLATQTGQTALTRIATVMAAKGGVVADITVGDCLQLYEVADQVGAKLHGGVHNPLFYQLLRDLGGFGEDAPAALRVFSGTGQPTCAQLIDRYHISCRPVRDLLVDYLSERKLASDFSSLQHLAYMLGKLFWADIEAHHPGIDTLKLPREVAAAWKQRVMTKTRTMRTGDGESVTMTAARVEGRGVLTAVRAFYLDVAEWADDDPRWVPWAVRCPISASEVSHKKVRAHRKSRTDQRTRERLPVLPALVAFVEAQREATAERLRAAENTPPGDVFSGAGQTLRRPVMKTKTTGRIWAEELDTGKRRDLTFEEHRGFWTWAMVEVLRQTGIRIEELTELSHHSLIQYRLPATGELVPLLQIAPSKTDTERLLVISPELADVLSAVVARVRGDRSNVPLVVAYDPGERVYNPPMPLLFQHRCQLEDRPVVQTSLRKYLDHALTSIGAKDASGSLLRYTFHDFRRIFITDAILHGMPPHIAQLVAGHRDINTTMGYKAVYPEEVIKGHREFIVRRRALRPAEEYRTPTDEEWEQFLGHFERRKVALGDCGRSYDTPCIHEHSCLRCPLLRPDPQQRPRLEQICDNLLARIVEAEERYWLGEAEGLKVSLAGARAKLAQMDQISARRGPVGLGVPAFRDVASRAVTTPVTLAIGGDAG